MKHILITLFISSISIGAFSQNDTIFYDADWKEIPEIADASFYRIIKTKTQGNYQIKDFYIDGTLQMSGISTSATKDSWEGPTIWFSKTGDTLEYTTYKNGRVEGIVKGYDEYTGKLLYTGAKKDNDKFGKWIVYGSLGNKEYEYFINEKGLQDTFYYYSHTGDLLIEMSFKDDKLLSHKQVNQRIIGDSISLKLNDSIGNKQEWLIFKNNKLHTKAYYKWGLRDSIAIVYHKDGETIEKKMRYNYDCSEKFPSAVEGGYAPDEFSFPSLYLNQHHQLLDSPFRVLVGGCLDGPYKEFYEDGAKRITGYFTDAFPSGIWKFYNDRQETTTFNFSEDIISQKEKLIIKFVAIEKNRYSYSPKLPTEIFFPYMKESGTMKNSDFHDFFSKYISQQNLSPEKIEILAKYFYSKLEVQKDLSYATFRNGFLEMVERSKRIQALFTP